MFHSKKRRTPSCYQVQKGASVCICASVLVFTNQDVVAAVAEAAGASKKDAENIINATLAQIEKVLVAGGKVQFVGFGTFETRERGERTAKNPRTGEAITVPASKAPAFKAGKALKDAVNK